MFTKTALTARPFRPLLNPHDLMVAEFDLSAFEGSSRHSCSETFSFQWWFFKGRGHVDLSIWKISPIGSFNDLPFNPEFDKFLLLFSYHNRHVGLW
jgi:hypothetical protein